MILVILFALIIYIVVSSAMIILVIAHTKSKICGVLAAIFFLLLPTWDVLCGKIIYSIACHHFPKVAIYKTVETEGIYYEGMNDYIHDYKMSNNKPLYDSDGIKVGSLASDLRKGYLYSEAKVTKKRTYAEINYYETIPSMYYRCRSFPLDPNQPDFGSTDDCQIVKQTQSRYMVQVNTSQFCTTTFNSKIISDRATGEILGEYKEVVNAQGFPFFSWFFKSEGSTLTLRCPYDKEGGWSSSRYNNFESEVLKPRNN